VGATGDDAAYDLRAALRLRSDRRARAGNLEWLRDQRLLELRLVGGGAHPRAPWRGAPRLEAASALAWSGTFVRRRTSPFLLIPRPSPIRIPFPFDVGLLAEAGGGAWEASRPDRLRVSPLRAALLFDLGRRAGVRRLAFGPEVAWRVDLERHRTPVNLIVPFTAGVLSARAEAESGLAAAELGVRGGAAVRVPGGAASFVEAVLSAERTVLALNDRPLAIFVECSARGGEGGRGAEAVAGLRLAAARIP